MVKQKQILISNKSWNKIKYIWTKARKIQLVRETQEVTFQQRFQAVLYWSMFVHRKWHDIINLRSWLHNSRTIHGRHWCLRSVNEKRIWSIRIDRRRGYKKFLGIEIIHIDEKRFKVSQPFLIDRVISLLDIDTNNYGMDTNAKSTPFGNPLLHKDLSGRPHK